MLNRFFWDQKLWSAYVSRGSKILKGACVWTRAPSARASRTEWGCCDPGKQIRFHLNLQQNFIWGRGRGLSIMCSDLLILCCCVRKISSVDIVKKCGFWTHGFSVLWWNYHQPFFSSFSFLPPNDGTSYCILELHLMGENKVCHRIKREILSQDNSFPFFQLCRQRTDISCHCETKLNDTQNANTLS